FVIYDSTARQYQTAQAVTTTTAGPVSVPTTQVSYNVVQLGGKGDSVTPATVSGGSTTKGADGSISYAPTYVGYDSTTRSYQTAQVVITTALPTRNALTGVTTPLSVTSRTNYTPIPLGIQGDTIVPISQI